MSPVFATATYAEPLDEAVLVAVTSMRVLLTNGRGEHRAVYGDHKTPLADDFVRELRRTHCPQCPPQPRVLVV